MITRESLNENPEICFEQLLTDTSALKYLYGPYLVMNNDFNNYKLTWGRNPILKMFLDVSTLIKLMKQSTEIRDLKTFIINYLSANSQYNENCWQAKVVTVLYQAIYENTKSFQYESKLLESALIDYAPIVQYNGMIKKPLMTSEASDVVTTLNSSNSPNTSILDNLLKNNLFSIMEYSIDGVTPFNDSDFFALCTARDNTDDLYNTISYFICAYVINRYNKEEIPNVVSTINSINYAKNNIAEEGFDVNVLLSKLENLSLDNNIESICESELNTMEYENDKQVESIMNKAHVDDDETARLSKNYNIDILLNYIYTSRRYMHNAYTNAFFVNTNQVMQDYSYMKDNILVAELEDHFLCTPVMDLADDYKVKLIRLDKDGIISITTLTN